MAKTTSDVTYVTNRRPSAVDPIVPESVIYDNKNRVVSIAYFVGFGEQTELVNFSYTEAGDLIFKGVEYRGYEFNMWEATIVPLLKSDDQTAQLHTANELSTITLLNLPTNNMLTTNNDYDILTDNEGEILFAPDIS